jgi:hypothetical protein
LPRPDERNRAGTFLDPVIQRVRTVRNRQLQSAGELLVGQVVIDLHADDLVEIRWAGDSRRADGRGDQCPSFEVAFGASSKRLELRRPSVRPTRDEFIRADADDDPVTPSMARESCSAGTLDDPPSTCLRQRLLKIGGVVDTQRFTAA